MTEILHQSLPDAQTGEPRLPGTMPCAADDWLRVDEVYSEQMNYRAKLLADSPQTVLYEHGQAQDANGEVLEEALGILPGLGFSVSDAAVLCPDGRKVAIDRTAPLHTLGHLVQEDVCVLGKQGSEHVMTGAVLCFPASWRLADKINRPLSGIHDTIEKYDDNIARRVQRLFDGVKTGQPLWRFNRLTYADADLHQPYRRRKGDGMAYTRTERQCILRLPKTDAVVFTIHTYIVCL